MFDAAKFDQAQFQARTATVAVPELASFFAEGAEPVFHVQGLDGYQLSEVYSASDKAKNIAALVREVSNGDPESVIGAIKSLLGANPDDVTREDAITICAFRLGCVDPAINQQQAVRLFKNFRVVVRRVADKILKLSGEGAEIVGESQSSGPILESK